jgi:hypothetical protein
MRFVRLLQYYFPPMFKEGKGLDYSFTVFEQRIRMQLYCLAFIVVLFFVMRGISLGIEFLWPNS